MDDNDYYGIELKVNDTKQKVTIDAGSPVTVMPCNPKLYKTENTKPMEERYQVVNKNEVKFLGQIWVDVEHNGIKAKLPLLITNDITPLVGVNWLKQLPTTIQNFSLDKETDQLETILTK